MGRSVKKTHLPFLKLLTIKGLCPKLRKVLLQQKGLVTSCCECSLNILNGNITLTEIEKKRLKKYKHLLRQLASKRIGTKKKERLLIQKGSGFLPLLILPALSLLTRMFNNDG